MIPVGVISDIEVIDEVRDEVENEVPVVIALISRVVVADAARRVDHEHYILLIV